MEHKEGKRAQEQESAMKISMSKMLMCRLRSFVCRRSFSATPLSLPLPLDTATCRARALWAGRFRMKKESLGNQFNIFLFKTKTHVDSVQQKFRARMQLNAHVLLAQQFCQFSGKLCTMLDSIRSEDPAFTPYIHPLYGVVEILNCYYSDTSEVDEHLCTQWFGDQRYSKLFQQWQDLRKGVKQRAQSLEAFLSPDRPRLMADDGKVPLESLLELSIQCYLDWVPNRQPKQYDIGTDIPHLSFVFCC
ncbi:uncharacterized protein LY89DRAFT_687027 [Mollisia scopiformis]|uniref:Uncharacterized protein n=1 Tax=Mollisia scopiformis TaxID=149040 RepID=A0A194X3I8_MOLSC|nr:uncharacterized protein LY89DRAFT_687027 [Mollisia scopiformis]KUJ14594.1 hypothetical protein LY89DRAFT_687027 [Mollisia scopiformis]